MMPPTPVTDDVLQQIAHAIAGIRYGSVQITIQDARVIQIEKAEKIRLKEKADLSTGGTTSAYHEPTRTLEGSDGEGSR